MTEALLIWAYISVGNVVNVIKFMFAMSPVIILGYLMFYTIPSASNYTKDRSLSKGLSNLYTFAPKKTIIALLALMLIYPTPKDLQYIIGGAVVINGVQAASDIEGIDQLPENLVNAANEFLKSLPKETK